MDVQQFLLLLVFASVLLGSPGPATMSLAASGATYGYRKSLFFLYGIITGFSLNLGAAALGLTAIFVQYPTIYEIFRYVSAVYILYLAWRIATSGTIKKADLKPFNYGQGVLLNLLNPKAYVAALACISQFVRPDADYTTQITIVVGVCLITAFILQFGWILAGDYLSGLFANERSARILNILMAIAMVICVAVVSFYL